MLVVVAVGYTTVGIMRCVCVCVSIESNRIELRVGSVFSFHSITSLKGSPEFRPVPVAIRGGLRLRVQVGVPAVVLLSGIRHQTVQVLGGCRVCMCMCIAVRGGIVLPRPIILHGVLGLLWLGSSGWCRFVVGVPAVRLDIVFRRPVPVGERFLGGGGCERGWCLVPLVSLEGIGHQVGFETRKGKEIVDFRRLGRLRRVGGPIPVGNRGGCLFRPGIGHRGQCWLCLRPVPAFRAGQGQVLGLNGCLQAREFAMGCE
mmetsp:Transcript_12462/g.25392  ORF Transcript_12462/g.25392 Transcript_12462/m.25392 type:complete len:258 (+) Transcript_12462:91-864(+)